MEVLSKLSPRVWLKLDATDIKTALQQSMRGEWNGDCDMGDGSLHDLRETYSARIATIDVLQSRDHAIVREALLQISADITADTQFLAQGLTEAIRTFQVHVL